jgi:hypothetical protein
MPICEFVTIIIKLNLYLMFYPKYQHSLQVINIKNR